jgi:hypothetical protein
LGMGVGVELEIKGGLLAVVVSGEVDDTLFTKDELDNTVSFKLFVVTGFTTITVVLIGLILFVRTLETVGFIVVIGAGVTLTGGGVTLIGAA